MSLHRKRRHGIGLKLSTSMLAAVAMASLLTSSPVAAETVNPDLERRCDIDVSLVLDASGSIAGFDAVDDVRQLGVDLTSSLADRGALLSVVEFATFADVAIAPTMVTTNSAETIFEPYFTGAASPSYYDGRIGRYTNWEDGLRLSLASMPAADLVVFVSDGVPNTVGDKNTAVEDNGGGDVASAAAAELFSDEITKAGSHMLALGVAGLNDDNGISLLKSISGPDDVRNTGVLRGDFFVGEFDELAAVFDGMIREICGGSLIVRSLLDADGDLTTTNDRTPIAGRPIVTAGADGLTQNAPVTQAGGTVVINSNDDQTATFDLVQQPDAGFYVAAAFCNGVSSTGFYDSGFSHRQVRLARTDLGLCTFINVELPAALDFDLNIDHILDVDQSGDNSPGDVIHYRAVASNVGGAVLNNVRISSELLSWHACQEAQGVSLDKGAVLTCLGVHVIGPDEPPAGIVHVASATSNEAGPVVDSERTRLPDAGLSFDKDVVRVEDLDGTRDLSEGDVIHYRLVATNIGTANLSNVKIVDNAADSMRCSPGNGVTLLAGQQVVCDGEIAVTAAHLGGQISNIASATSDQVGPIFDGEHLAAPQVRARFSTIITHYDDLDDNGSPSRGDRVHVLNVGTNTGASNLSGLSIDDDLSGSQFCDSGLTSLSPGATRHCRGTYNITIADHGGDLIANGEMRTLQVPQLLDNDSLPVPIAELEVVGVLDRLVDNDNSLDPSPGDRAIFRFTASNVGEMTLTDVDFDVYGLSNVRCLPADVDRLAVGEFIECVGERLIDASHLGTTLAPSALATSWQAPSATDDVELDVPTPDARIEKSVASVSDRDTNDRTTVGDGLVYQILVTNAGSANLVLGEILDPQLPAMTCEFPAGFDRILYPDEVVVCRGVRILNVDDAATTITNTASVSSPQLDRELSSSVSFEVPLSAACNDGAIWFGQEHLLAGSVSAGQAANLSAGRYNITLVSYDNGHRAGHQIAQNAERWMVEFLDDRGNVIARSSQTLDLADADRIERYLVETDLVVPAGAVAVRAAHGASSGVNSIAPLCAEIIQVEAFEPTDPTDPSDPSDPSDPLQCVAGDVDLASVLLMGRDGHRVVEVPHSLSAGTYRLAAISEDLGHAAGYQSGQTMEQWRIDFVGADGQVVASSGYTDDLAEQTIRNRSDLGQISLNDDVVTLRLVHREDARLDSIHPVCASINAA